MPPKAHPRLPCWPRAHPEAVYEKPERPAFSRSETELDFGAAYPGFYQETTAEIFLANSTREPAKSVSNSSME